MSTDRRHDGVRVIQRDALDPSGTDVPGGCRAGALAVRPAAGTGPHRHGDLEDVFYVVRGRARMTWGENREFAAEAGPGAFISVPPFVPRQQINALDDEPLECVLTRSGQAPIVVSLDVDGVAEPGTGPTDGRAHPGR
ncbi:cupin domain-containing protein [Pseudonocardia sp. HH130630-07]|uniref:cupin domain-containing protein n=1 Tax=Pseudonocardia sp. HH130630-07 TaxID=1690815 RepID=UPI0008152E34|nr:cupin domain-containing protein [Pseudonocardia sp. HH130630-07]ANY09020.1 mannose-6-phosphate isomerase [Pseudonocardia sp. HH130630-07]